MSKTLVAFFSATGTTKTLANNISKALEADLFEIKPKVLYTNEDLNWMDKKSRSSTEMADSNSRPEIAELCHNIDDYETILIGFPIWWYVAPTIINTFLESHNFANKKVILFATSGGSKFGKTIEKLFPSAKRATLVEGGVLPSTMSQIDIMDWYSKL